MTTGQRLASNWPAIALRGVAAVVFGLFLLFWPAPTLLTLIYIFGIFVLVEGIAAVVAGVRQPQGVSWALVVLGLIGIGAGIATFVWPGITGLILLYVIGFWAIASGVVQIYEGIRLRRSISNEWLLIATGVVSVIFGLIVVITPSTGALALAYFIGFFGLIYGVLQIALALRLRAVEEAGRA